MSEPIWFDQPQVLFEKENLKKFVWLPGMTYNEKQNAIVRFFLYFSLIGFLYFNSTSFIWFFLVVLAILYYSHHKHRAALYRWLNVAPDGSGRRPYYEQSGGGLEDVYYGGSKADWEAVYGPGGAFEGYSNDLVDPKVRVDPGTNQVCKVSTPDNPFGNTLPGDNEVLNATPLCDPDAQRQTIEENFNKGLFSDLNDIFQRNNFQRQYNVNPQTTIPNDRASFMKWCWETPFSLKDGDQDSAFKQGY